MYSALLKIINALPIINYTLLKIYRNVIISVVPCIVILHKIIIHKSGSKFVVVTI